MDRINRIYKIKKNPNKQFQKNKPAKPFCLCSNPVNHVNPVYLSLADSNPVDSSRGASSDTNARIERGISKINNQVDQHEEKNNDQQVGNNDGPIQYIY